MSLLDMKTVMFSYVISDALCAAVMIFLLFQNRHRSPGMGFWLADYALQFVAILLITLRSIVPDFASMVVSNALVIGGTLLLFIGLERYVGKTSSQIHNYILLAIFIGIHIYFIYVQSNLYARTNNVTLALLVICTQCAWLMLHRVESKMRSGTKLVGLVFAAYVLVSIIRFSINFAVPQEIDFFKSGFYDTLMILIFQMLFIGLTFALFLMVNRRIHTELELDISNRKTAEKEIRSLSKFPDENPSPIFRISANGTILYANRGCQPLLQMWGRKVGEPAPEEFKKIIANAQKSEKLKEIEVECEQHTYSLAIIPVSFEEYVNIYGRDITKRKLAEEATRVREERFRAVVQAASDAIVNIQGDGTIVFWNKAAENIFGYSTDEIIGRPLTQIMPSKFRNIQTAELKRAVSTGKSNTMSGVIEVQGRRKNGSTFPVELSMSNWKTSEGIFFTAIVRDITERRRMQETLRLDNKMMVSITDGMLLYKANNGKIVFTNPQFDHLFAYNPGELIGKNVSILNASADKSAAEVAAEIHETVFKNGSWDGDIQNIKKDGTIFWCRASVSTFTHEVWGKVCVAVQQDITARKQAEEILREREELFRTTFESSIAGISMVSLDGKFMQINNKLCEILGYTPKELILLKFNDVTYPEDKEIGVQYLKQMALGKISDVSFEKRYVKKNGEIIWVFLSISAIHDKAGKPQYFVAYTQDITERKQVENVIHQWSTHDSLTGLYNRAFFDAEMKRMERGRQYPISIVMADVDKLKSVNDTYGHTTGDKLLQFAAQVLTKSFRSEDIVARIGGDEYAALLPNADAKTAKQALVRIRSNVLENNKVKDSIPLSISLGTSTAKSGADLKIALAQADENMYHEKKGKIK